MARATPHITDGILTYRDGMQEHTIAVGSPMWRQWLAAATTTTFRFEHPLCNFTARRERKRDGSYWYAYRTRGGALQKAYLGKSTDLTLDRLQEVAAGFARRSAAPTPAAPVTGITSTEAAGPLPGALAGGLHDPLVTTKLALPPARPALVPRPRLMDRLEAGLQRKLTLIAAPAGYGKTTLVSAWHATAPGSAWPLAWLSLDEVRAADLGFTTDEVETFFNQLLDLRLATDQVAALAARTEGWITGLVLVAHALPGHANAATFIRELAGSHRFILDYLVEDVLQQQPSHIQRFLLDTAILNQLTASLCDALLLGDDAPPDAAYSQLVLDELERKNLFLIPLDRQRRWYRYHQLFAEMLRSRAQAIERARALGLVRP